MSAKCFRISSEPGDPAVAQKKIVHELHHAPSLVGRIVEKGFSPVSDSGGGSGNPSSTLLPRPTLLPFPVARHRSRGPHWAPIGSAPFDAEEDDMEDDNDVTNYESIASFGIPVEKKKKKPLDFSRWKEFVNQDEASVAPSKKKEAKTNEGKTKEVNKSGVVSDERKEKLCSATSLSGATPDSEDMMLGGLKIRSFSGGRTLTTEPKSLMELESEVTEAKSLASTTSANYFPTRAEPTSHIDEVEMAEVKDRSLSLKDDIDAENLSRLKQMSAEEIAEARAEIMEKINPGVIKMLKKRGQSKLRGRKGIKLESNNGREELASSKQVESGKNLKPIAPPSDWISKSETDSSLWKSWSERVEKVRSMRFSLDGKALEFDSMLNMPNGDKPNVCAFSVENVIERDLLRSEGDPAALGYTINEAVALTRSMIPGQRAIALQLLASVFNNALYNIQQTDNGCCAQKTNVSDDFVDWQAVWAFALGPEPQLVLSLRIALDDNHDSVVLACVKAILSLLSFDINENFADTSEKLTNSKKNTFTAPVFRSRPSIEDGFLHGNYWKYSAKPSNILPTNNQNNEDGVNEGQHTIQDDVVVAGQDVAAGLVRMGILPRICYLLEMDPLPALEESLVSIVAAIARHSPTCVDAIMKCPNLIQTVVKIFTKPGSVEGYPSQIKAVLLLKVLCQANKQICLDFVKRGVFQQAVWHWYKNVFTLESWVKCGRESCKLNSQLMVEQLRLWKVCIRYGYCISYFADFFPAMCLWLGPPMFDKLLAKNVLREYTSITREAYLVLEALSQKLPAFHSTEQKIKQEIMSSDGATEAWSWNHVAPMVDLAVSWLSIGDIPYISSLSADSKKNVSHVEDASVACLLWVISAVLNMLCIIFDKVAPGAHDEFDNRSTSLPLLPNFVPKVGLKIIKHRFLNFSSSSKFDFEAFPTESGSLASCLCFMRLQRNYDVSLSALSCLLGLVRLSLLVDECIHRAISINCSPSFSQIMSRSPEKILEEGIISSAHNELSQVITLFAGILSSEWQVMQSAEMIGRGGPAPGIGFGWGSCGGGFWSLNVLRTQTDVQLIMKLHPIISAVFENDLTRLESMKTVTNGSDNLPHLQRINSILGVCLLAGPGDDSTLEKAWDYLFQASVLKYLNSCMNDFLCRMKFFNTSDWQYNEEDLYIFSKILNAHYRERWLTAKRKKTFHGVDSSDVDKRSHVLETIQEEIELESLVSREQSRNSLLVEWAHQRLPLPTHWFLSAVCIMGDLKRKNTSPYTDLDVAKSGLFFLLGLEIMSSLLHSNPKECPISSVPLVWKLHALSMALRTNMDVLREEKSMNVFRTLQDIYGQRISQLKCVNSASKDENFQDCLAPSSEVQVSEVLSFQTTIHESYNVFVENVVEQFCAISYGDLIYGRQVAVYLHRTVEPSIRLAVWNALSDVGALQFLPPIEKCIANAKGYLEPVEDKEEILEAYAKSLNTGALDKAATRESVSFTLAVHHLSLFLFSARTLEKLTTWNKLAKSILRSHMRKQHDEGLLCSLVQYGLSPTEDSTYKTEITSRLEVLKEACEGNTSLLDEKIIEDIIQDDEGLLCTLIRYGLSPTEDPYKTEITSRLDVLKEVCEENASLLAEVDKL